jgi:aspartate--ammonia ligase
MNAIRRDEETDNLHSLYVDQWDWEKVIHKDERNERTLKAVVRSVYQALKDTEKYLAEKYDYIKMILPEEITFLTSQELEDAYPSLSPRERENEASKKN